ncbi:hypothetical protein CSA56_11550 [candidate division KSB3 bacterium]|uniref:Uncharacterized protein n=1 Tax=candidate division KSB3 bacterium TaxID=2044937 RepID=A0A2G6KCS1_9BACT|nr:MAG: hypothetical protein CSA56_11550 [candidate division KSB3 bacterium]
MNPICTALIESIKHRDSRDVEIACDRLKNAVITQYSEASEVVTALRLLEHQPTSELYQNALQKAFENEGIEGNDDLLQAAQDGLKALKDVAESAGIAEVEIENIQAAAIRIDKILAQGRNSSIVVKDLKADQAVNLNEIKAGEKSSSSQQTTQVDIHDVHAQTVTVHVGQSAAEPDSEQARKSYLRNLFCRAKRLELEGLDLRAANEKEVKSPQLSDVYTALLTVDTDRQERMMSGEGGDRKLSALEQLNRHQRLVLLGAGQRQKHRCQICGHVSGRGTPARRE